MSLFSRAMIKSKKLDFNMCIPFFFSTLFHRGCHFNLELMLLLLRINIDQSCEYL